MILFVYFYFYHILTLFLLSNPTFLLIIYFCHNHLIPSKYLTVFLYICLLSFQISASFDFHHNMLSYDNDGRTWKNIHHHHIPAPTIQEIQKSFDATTSSVNTRHIFSYLFFAFDIPFVIVPSFLIMQFKPYTITTIQFPTPHITLTYIAFVIHIDYLRTLYVFHFYQTFKIFTLYKIPYLYSKRYLNIVAKFIFYCNRHILIIPYILIIQKKRRI